MKWALYVYLTIGVVIAFASAWHLDMKRKVEWNFAMILANVLIIILWLPVILGVRMKRARRS